MKYDLYYATVILKWSEYENAEKYMICPIICDSRNTITKDKIIGQLKKIIPDFINKMLDANFKYTWRDETRWFLNEFLFRDKVGEDNLKVVAQGYCVNQDDDCQYANFDILKMELPLTKFPKVKKSFYKYSFIEKICRLNKDITYKTFYDLFKIKDCFFGSFYSIDPDYDTECPEDYIGFFHMVSKNLFGLLEKELKDTSCSADIIQCFYNACYGDNEGDARSNTHYLPQKQKLIKEDGCFGLATYNHPNNFIISYDDNGFNIRGQVMLIPVVSYNIGDNLCGEK